MPSPPCSGSRKAGLQCAVAGRCFSRRSPVELRTICVLPDLGAARRDTPRRRGGAPRRYLAFQPTFSDRPSILNTPNLAIRRGTRKSTFRHYDISQGYPSEMSFKRVFSRLALVQGGRYTRVGLRPHTPLQGSVLAGQASLTDPIRSLTALSRNMSKMKRL
jgi:hypothetical protein